VCELAGLGGCDGLCVLGGTDCGAVCGFCAVALVSVCEPELCFELVDELRPGCAEAAWPCPLPLAPDCGLCVFVLAAGLVCGGCVWLTELCREEPAVCTAPVAPDSICAFAGLAASAHNTAQDRAVLDNNLGIDVIGRLCTNSQLNGVQLHPMQWPYLLAADGQLPHYPLPGFEQ
jgi:hypothetical protein